jgi:homocysteine S-methyltransferase
MSALALCALIQQQTERPATLHCTTRDHNRLSMQGLLWGASALGIETVLIATGDFVALGDRVRTTTVRDVDVFALVRMAREAGLRTGVVLDPHPEADGLEQSVRRLERKTKAGAQFAITQPVYDAASAQRLAEATQHIRIPIILGILPLRTARHAEFLHHKVAGIAVPAHVRERMARAKEPVTEGTMNAREMLAVARQLFSGACIMPPFDHYEGLFAILHDDG